MKKKLTLCVSAHVVLNLLEAKRKVLEKETGAIIPRFKFGGSEIYRSGRTLELREGGKTRIVQGVYNRAMGNLLVHNTFLSLVKPYPGMCEHLASLHQYVDRIEMVKGGHKLAEHTVTALVAKQKLAIDDVVLTHGDDEIMWRRYRDADIVVETRLEHLLQIGSSDQLKILVRVPRNETGGGIEIDEDAIKTAVRDGKIIFVESMLHAIPHIRRFAQAKAQHAAA